MDLYTVTSIYMEGGYSDPEYRTEIFISEEAVRKDFAKTYGMPEDQVLIGDEMIRTVDGMWYNDEDLAIDSGEDIDLRCRIDIHMGFNLKLVK